MSPHRIRMLTGAGSRASLNGLSGEKLFACIIFGGAVVNRSKAAGRFLDHICGAMKKGFVDASSSRSCADMFMFFHGMRGLCS